MSLLRALARQLQTMAAKPQQLPTDCGDISLSIANLPARPVAMLMLCARTRLSRHTKLPQGPARHFIDAKLPIPQEIANFDNNLAMRKVGEHATVRQTAPTGPKDRSVGEPQGLSTSVEKSGLLLVTQLKCMVTFCDWKRW